MTVASKIYPANRMRRSLRALPITDTELKLIAAAAIMGFSSADISKWAPAFLLQPTLVDGG